MLTLATCACAVAVAHGQVSVPKVQTPSVNTPPLQNLPQVPTTPSVPVPSVPKVPSVQVPSAPKVPSVKLPNTGSTPKLPSVQAPSTGINGSAGGGSAGAGSAPANPATSAAGASGGSGSPSAARAAAARRAGHRPLTPRQRSARHERRLRTAARELEGCLSALSGFERDVIVLRGGLHGRQPLSRSKTAARLDVGSSRVRSAERSGLAGLRRADAEQGCGLRSGAGRDAAARRLADGSVPSLSPLAVAGSSPELVSTGKLAHDHGKVLGEHASSGAKPEPRRAGVVPTSGGDGSPISAAALAALLAGLLVAGVVALLVWRRRTADSYGYSHQPSVYPYGWSSYESNTPSEPAAPPEAPSAATEPAAQPMATAAPPTPRRRDRAMQAFGGLAASGAALSLLLGRLASRRRRR